MTNAKTVALFAPIRVTVEFEMTNGDDTARAEFTCPLGELPTIEAVAEWAEEFKETVIEQFGTTFRWPTRHEFINAALADRIGLASVKFATPGPEQFAAGWTK